MPELPEVEAARKKLETNCLNKRIDEVIAADDDKVIEGVTPSELASTLMGRTITAVRRKGKHLWVEMDGNGPWPLFHFGMTGSMAVRGQGHVHYRSTKVDDSGDWPPRYWKVVLNLEGGTSVAFCDSRRFGRVRLPTDPLQGEILGKLGFDVLLELPSKPDFEAVVRARARASTRIKALLLDQEFAAGVGNWVADEVLYQSRIHPEHPVAALDSEALGRVHDALREVVGTAVDVDADSDRFPRDWIFHYRWTGKVSCNDYHGNKVEFVTAGGRTSAYVPTLQKLPPGISLDAGPSGKAPSRKKQAAKSKEPGEDDGDAQTAMTKSGAKANAKSNSAAAQPAGAGKKPSAAAKKLAASKTSRAVNAARKRNAADADVLQDVAEEDAPSAKRQKVDVSTKGPKKQAGPAAKKASAGAAAVKKPKEEAPAAKGNLKGAAKGDTKENGEGIAKANTKGNAKGKARGKAPATDSRKGAVAAKPTSAARKGKGRK